MSGRANYGTADPRECGAGDRCAERAPTQSRHLLDRAGFSQTRFSPFRYSACSADIRLFLAAYWVQGFAGLTGNYRDRGKRLGPSGYWSNRTRPSPWCLRFNENLRGLGEASEEWTNARSDARTPPGHP